MERSTFLPQPKDAPIIKQAFEFETSVAVTEAEDADDLASGRELTQRFRNTLGCTLVDVASVDAKDLASALPTEARVVTLEELSADELLAAGGGKQSSNARIPHATPTPTAGVAEDETQENDNSSAP